MRIIAEPQATEMTQLEVSIEHIPHVNVYGIECCNYLSSTDSATPRD